MQRNIKGSLDQMLALRGALLSNTDWLCRRHDDQQYMGGPMSITDSQFEELLTYRQALRDWDRVSPLPSKPEWMI